MSRCGMMCEVRCVTVRYDVAVRCVAVRYDV